MKEASDELRFEDAQNYKNKIEVLQKHYARSIVTAATDTDCDVFSLVFEASEAFGNFLRVRGGAIIQSLNLGFKLNIEEEPASVLSAFIAEIESKFGALAKEILVPFKPDVRIEGSRFGSRSAGANFLCWNSAPKRTRTPVQLASAAGAHGSGTVPENRIGRTAEGARYEGITGPHRMLRQFQYSRRQSCGCLRRIQERRTRQERIPGFKIKTVIGANDYASMKEVVNRRYARMLAEHPELPQLIVIDGGKGACLRPSSLDRTGFGR